MTNSEKINSEKMNPETKHNPDATFSGTMPVPAHYQFDLSKLEAYLSLHIQDFAGPIEISQFKGGQSNPTYLLKTPLQTYTMRSKPGPVAKLLPSAHAIEREYRVQAALGKVADTPVPVAKMYVLCEDESIIGRAFYIMEYVQGRVFWEQSLPALPPDERRAIYLEMNRVIAALHSVDFAAVALGDYGKTTDYMPRQIARWSKQYKASETETIASMDKLMAWLPAHCPAQTVASIVHGDYRIDNLIFHPTEPRILAVLDWELSTLGDPLADISYHTMSWGIPPGQFRGLGGLDLVSLGIPTVEEYRALYCAATHKPALENSDFYAAYNLFRMTGILQGIMKRVVDGTASSAQAVAAGKSARGIADMGWAFARAAGAADIV